MLLNVSAQRPLIQCMLGYGGWATEGVGVGL
jgi:hypothetical protein